jgi:hypothetical protein
VGRTVASLLEELSEKELAMHERYGYYVYEEDVEDWGRYGLRPEVIEVSPRKCSWIRYPLCTAPDKIFVSGSPFVAESPNSMLGGQRASRSTKKEDGRLLNPYKSTAKW